MRRPRFAFLLKGSPVQVLARMRSDGVLRRGCPTQAPAHPGSAAPARRPVRLRAARHLGHPGHRYRHRHMPLRPNHRPLMEPAPPQADPPLLLGRGRRHPPDRRGHRDPPGHRPPAQRSNPQACLALVVRHRRHPRGLRPSRPPPRPRTATGPKEHPARTPPRRSHPPQNTVGETANAEVGHPTTTPHRSKIKPAQCDPASGPSPKAG